MNYRTKYKPSNPKKACGVDGILNEMIKNSNIILNSGIFPNIWNQDKSTKGETNLTPITTVGYASTATLGESSA
jgi:hypothetical protein